VADLHDCSQEKSWKVKGLLRWRIGFVDLSAGILAASYWGLWPSGPAQCRYLKFCIQASPFCMQLHSLAVTLDTISCVEILSLYLSLALDFGGARGNSAATSHIFSPIQSSTWMHDL
jgi:hypothetical protein